MAPRLLLLLTLLCAVLVAPATAAADELRRHAGAAEPHTAEEALSDAKAALNGAGVDTGREVSPALRVLAEKLPELDRADRRQARRILARPVPGQANGNESTYDVPVHTLAGPHFNVHYVKTVSRPQFNLPPAGYCRHPSDDRPPQADGDLDGHPDYVEQMLAEFEHVHNVQNGALGWARPKADFGKGGDNKTDVYVKNIGPEGIFGYAAPDGSQPLDQGRNKLAAYLVMDNDYCVNEFGNYRDRPLDALRVTAAHEYNHILQFNYDALQDNWMFESTAVWMEDVVYDSINDYRNYLPAWSRLSLAPLTRFDVDPRNDNVNNAKAYGDVMFTRWVAERYGATTIRTAWERSIATRSFAPDAYEAALRPRTTMFDVFSSFAADTAEWRLANGPFEEGSDGNGFPDMQRALRGDRLAPQTVTRDRNDYVEGGIDHLSYALFNVDPRGQSQITVGATFNRGVKGAVALVGRTGDDRGGRYVVRMTRMPAGGVGRVTLPNATSFSRITAVLINADTRKSGYSEDIADWLWLGDDEPITLAVNDFTTPRARRYSPKRGARRVSTRTSIAAVFDEGLAGVTERNVRITGPRGKRVRFSITQSRDGRTVRFRPTRRLARGNRYTVKLGAGVTDGGGNRLPASRRTWRFTTRR